MLGLEGLLAGPRRGRIQRQPVQEEAEREGGEITGMTHWTQQQAGTGGRGEQLVAPRKKRTEGRTLRMTGGVFLADGDLKSHI